MFKRIINYYRKFFWTPLRYGRFIGVKIGEDCSIATKYFGSEPYLIEIGHHVQITNDVRFFTHSGGWIYRYKYPKMDAFGKITIGNNVYIGNCALILPGVTIGNDVIIGAGTIVTRSVEEFSIIAGNPGKKIGDTRELENRLLKLNVNTKGLSYKDKKKVLLSLDENKFIIK